MRFHLAVLRASSVVLAVTLLAAPAWAGWGTMPVTVRATSAAIPTVAACNDGGYGTFVAWQEEASAGSGQVRVLHLLPTGDLDPAWPADGAPACTRAAARTTIAALPDHLGGVYLWWVETTTLYVTRLQPDGSAAAGWPVDGLSLGPISAATDRPSAIEDAANGIYLAWTTGMSVRAHHLGPNGLGAQGWPNTPRTVVPVDPTGSSIRLWPDLAPSPDGGIYLSWATWSLDTTMAESSMRLRRLTAAGLNASGWPSEGLVLGPFRPEPLGQMPRAPLLDISPDGRGGVFVHAGAFEETMPFVDCRLYRLGSDGQTDPQWPADGYLIKAGATYYAGNPPGIADAGLRVHSDLQGRAIVEYPNAYSDSPAMIGVSHVDNLGVVGWPKSVIAIGHEVVVRPDGGFYASDFKCCGPASQWDWPAMLGLHAEPDGAWSSYFDVHSEPVLSWYGDIALASTGDGGVVYYWSQNNSSYGLFARRFNPTQEITAVGPRRPRFALRGVRFVSGSGVVAQATSEGRASLELFDLNGRRVSSRAIPGDGSGEVVLPGTASLSSGLYFVRLRDDDRVALGRIVITR